MWAVWQPSVRQLGIGSRGKKKKKKKKRNIGSWHTTTLVPKLELLLIDLLKNLVNGIL
jgi:hypothetical protein